MPAVTPEEATPLQAQKLPAEAGDGHRGPSPSLREPALERFDLLAHGGKGLLQPLEAVVDDVRFACHDRLLSPRILNKIMA